MPDLPKLPPGQPTFFTIAWGPGHCVVDGPFGDDSAAAINCAKKVLTDYPDTFDGAGVFLLHLHEVRLEDKPL